MNHYLILDMCDSWFLKIGKIQLINFFIIMNLLYKYLIKYNRNLNKIINFKVK